MLCPKCRSSMLKIPATYGSSVHRCENCHGIACGDESLSALQRQWFLWPRHDPRDIDSGAARDGRRWDKLTHVDCPGCDARMRTVSAAGQEHIRLDRCDPCGLTFFDAGEMTDLRYETLTDSVRGLIARMRRA